MSRSSRPRVIVLYAHPLLGEGLANLLSAQAGVGAIAVDGRDEAARATALSSHPDLVIVEEAEATRSFELSGSMPVVFVRVDVEDGKRVGQPLADPEMILALARGLANSGAS